MTRAYRQIDEHVIDDEGVVLKTTHTEISFKYNEPPFVKLYLNDLARLNDLLKGDSNVMHELCRLIGYDNRVILNATIKREIAQKLGWKNYRQVDDAIQALKKKGIFSSVGKGVLMANPDLFGRGGWEDIKKLRTTITYTENGRFLVTEVTSSTDATARFEQARTQTSNMELEEEGAEKVIDQAKEILDSTTDPKQLDLFPIAHSTVIPGLTPERLKWLKELVDANSVPIAILFMFTASFYSLQQAVEGFLK